MIPRRQYVRSKRKKLIGSGWCYAKAAGRVFCIHDQQIHLLGRKERRQVFADDMTPGMPKHIADEKYAHGKPFSCFGKRSTMLACFCRAIEPRLYTNHIDTHGMKG